MRLLTVVVPEEVHEEGCSGPNYCKGDNL